jgi:hypothetical protein
LVNFADLLYEYSFSFSHAKSGDQERDAKSTGSTDISAAVSKHARPILISFVVELFHVSFELGDILWVEYFSKDGRSSGAVLVGDSVEEERPCSR